MTALDRKLQAAVSHFWNVRSAQTKRQGARSGSRDAGARRAVTGGKQMDGFIRAIREVLVEAGLDEVCIHCEKRTELPGYFRPEKRWDLVVVAESKLIAGIEFKSHVGPSFGNNFNNRSEEAIGSATDLWTAFREGAFRAAEKPWLGYLMLLEETPRSTTPVKPTESHFPVFPEFRSASYANRYELLLTRLMRERLYDSACLLLSNSRQGRKGAYHEPLPELTFQKMTASLVGRALALTKLLKK